MLPSLSKVRRLSKVRVCTTTSHHHSHHLHHYYLTTSSPAVAAAVMPCGVMQGEAWETNIEFYPFPDMEANINIHPQFSPLFPDSIKVELVVALPCAG